MKPSLPSHSIRHWLILLTLAATACNPRPETPTATPQLSTPTATPVPMVAVVNGEGITQEEFEQELARYQSAMSTLGEVVSPEDASRVVLDDLVSQALLTQGALAAGYQADAEELQSRLDQLADAAGGVDALAAWIGEHGYTDETFRRSLERALAAAWMRDRIASDVPLDTEQVHVRQIILYTEQDAREALAALDGGYDFTELAAHYDPVTRGELGWFPRGYLLEPAFEQAAFALQPGEYSGIVQTSVGYHILYVIEKDPARPLTPDALLALQDLALENWLREQRAQSTITLSP
ncbi:MAG: hypothetical protein FJZ96_05735 [Chloroflexi bacterium]|nr:hypothetical protein [Chloroflexota bacterium]